MVIRRLWDQLDLGTWIDRRARMLGGYFRPSLMVELWVVFLLYGGRVLVLDSTVVLCYSLKQAGAERGYNPKKPGRPSHHPLLAFIQETGDCMGAF